VDDQEEETSRKQAKAKAQGGQGAKTPDAPGWTGVKEAAEPRTSPDPPWARLMREAGQRGEH
jgi:hypothetical protein